MCPTASDVRPTSVLTGGVCYNQIDAGYLDPARDANGTLQVNRTKFGSGMRHLSDYLSARGIGLGVYTDIGRHLVFNWVTNNAKTISLCHSGMCTP